MWKEALLAYVSQLRGPVSGNPTSLPAPRYDLATYSVRLNESNTETVFSLRDCYVDELVTPGKVAKNSVIFKLNTFELVRETFKLAQELELSKLAAARLGDDYLERLIFSPLRAAVTAAMKDVVAYTDLLEATRERFRVGELTITDVALAEAALEEASGRLAQSRINLNQRSLEIEGQKRRLIAEQTDLSERMYLNSLIGEVHLFRLSADANVEVHTFPGAFVEEGDPICTLRKV